LFASIIGFIYSIIYYFTKPKEFDIYISFIPFIYIGIFLSYYLNLYKINDFL
jgi:hypothetical protein